MHRTSIPAQAAAADATTATPTDAAVVSGPRAPACPGDEMWRLPAAAEAAAAPEPVCRWDFSAPGEEALWSSGRERFRLVEMAGPVARGSDGPGGGATLELEEGNWLRCPRAECPALNIHGAGARFSIVAWVRRRPKRSDGCEVVAGMWNETRCTRQYCLFLNLQIWDGVDQACGHLSATGAPTPGYKYCMEAAMGATQLGFDQWRLVAFTYDGVWGRVYVDGRFDYRPGLNPYHWPHAINDGGDGGSDFTVGAVFRGGEMGNWFRGSLGGLAVYDACLSEADIARRWRDKTV